MLLGLDRTERGRSAGLRTLILVCLAASVSMLQVSFLLDSRGKASDSFIVMDLMRLPLGILTGMGFIGAGAIIRRGNVIDGVTTAATLWLATVIGLCLGGGQLLLGMVTLGIALVVLWALRRVEHFIQRDCRAVVVVRTVRKESFEEEFRAVLVGAGYRIGRWSVLYQGPIDDRQCTIRCEVHWTGLAGDTRTPQILERIRDERHVQSVRWNA
jgi:putative Mg2+ transporter-C (MgtC) family protein